MASESYSVAEASHRLGVSIPTVKAMYQRGELAGFKTPGQHLRITAESVDAIRNNGRAPASSSVSGPSSALRMRQERIQELHLEGEELRSRAELDRLQIEQDQEQERRAEADRTRQVELEERQEIARAERLRQERLQQEAAAEQRRAALRQQVQLALHATLPASLTPDHQKELADTLEEELRRAGVETADTAAPIIRSVVSRFVETLLAQQRKRQREDVAQRDRSHELDMALWRVKRCGSTEADEVEAAKAIRDAFAELPGDATDRELRSAADAATAPVREKIHQRLRRNGTIESGVREVDPYLERLKRSAGIEYDFVFVSRLKDAVRARLGVEVTNQTHSELRRLVHEIIDREIG